MSQHPTILVDDTDSNVQYSGQWFTRAGVTTSTSGNGPAYLDSQHGTYSDGSISYTFNGTEIAVIGAAYNISEPTFPRWNCFLDGVNVGEGSSFDAIQARQQLCFSQSLDPSIPHTINVTIQGNENQAFLLDYFQYTPLPSAPLENVVIRMESNDSSLKYDDGWQDSIQPDGKFTINTNASLFLPFTGNSLTWWGSTVNDSSFASIPATGTYSVDGSQPITFEIPTLLSTSSVSQLNEKYFDTGPLRHGKHNLVVTYHGFKHTVPLFLNYLLIQTGSDALPQSPLLAGLPSSDPSPSQCSSSPKNLTSYIVGSVLGGLTFIAIGVITIVIYLRCRRRAAQRETARKSYDFRRQGVATQSSMTTTSIIGRWTDRSWTTSTHLTLTDVITEGTASTSRSYSTRRTATDSSKPASQATMYTAGRSTTASEGGNRDGSVY